MKTQMIRLRGMCVAVPREEEIMPLNCKRLLLTIVVLCTALKCSAATTWYVNGATGRDSNNCLSASMPCKTIGQAVSLAASGDSIVVAAATYSEHLTIGKSLSITGQSASATIIDGGRQSGPVVTIANTAVHASLSQLTIRNGGPGISNAGTLSLTGSVITGNHCSLPRFHFQFPPQCSGGGISNSGTLTITTTTISGNSAPSGGGISNSGTLGISKSTLSGNSATVFAVLDGLPEPLPAGGSGGAIANSGVVIIANSTLDSNNAAKQPSTEVFSRGEGGALSNSGKASISNATFSNNAAYCTSGGSGVAWVKCSGPDGLGGAIYNNGTTLTIQNTIVAYNLDGGNCYGSGITSDGYNLSSDGTCSFHNSGDRNSVNPLLGPLQNNGGLTQTRALLTGSPAIDAGNPSGCTDGSGHLLTTDQRGEPRPDSEDKTGCDIGAYESQSD